MVRATSCAAATCLNGRRCSGWTLARPGTGLSYRATRKVSGRPAGHPPAAAAPTRPITRRNMLIAAAVTLFALTPLIPAHRYRRGASVGMLGSHAYILAIPLSIVAPLGLLYAAMWIRLYALGVLPPSVSEPKATLTELPDRLRLIPPRCAGRSRFRTAGCMLGLSRC